MKNIETLSELLIEYDEPGFYRCFSSGAVRFYKDDLYFDIDDLDELSVQDSLIGAFRRECERREWEYCLRSLKCADGVLYACVINNNLVAETCPVLAVVSAFFNPEKNISDT